MKQTSTIAEVEEAIKAPKVVNLNLDPSQRPLTGLDIDYFRSHHGLPTVEVINALCIQNSAAYNKAVREPVLPYNMEMLIRLYDLHTEPAPWVFIEPTKAFEMLYGDVMEQFRGTEYEKDARLALYKRFTAGCGRSIFTAYRWIDEEGKSKRGVTKVFAKLSKLDNPREVFESLARTIFKSRGVDFDSFCPMPTLENPPKPKPRGPTPKNLVKS